MSESRGSFANRCRGSRFDAGVFLQGPKLSIALRTLEQMLISRRIQGLAPCGETHEHIVGQAANSLRVWIGIRQEAIDLISAALVSAILSHRPIDTNGEQSRQRRRRVRAPF